MNFFYKISILKNYNIIILQIYNIQSLIVSKKMKIEKIYIHTYF